MKKFDFVEDLMAHGFRDITDPKGLELCREAGYETARLNRDFTKVIEDGWSGRKEYSYRIEIFVNKTSNVCQVEFYSGVALAKRKWYKIGRQAYNAIAATLLNAGLDI